VTKFQLVLKKTRISGMLPTYLDDVGKPANSAVLAEMNCF